MPLYTGALRHPIPELDSPSVLLLPQKSRFPPEKERREIERERKRARICVTLCPDKRRIIFARLGAPLCLVYLVAIANRLRKFSLCALPFFQAYCVLRAPCFSHWTNGHFYCVQLLRYPVSLQRPLYSLCSFTKCGQNSKLFYCVCHRCFIRNLARQITLEISLCFTIFIFFILYCC